MTTSAVPYMAAESDTDRVNRSFLGFMQSALGVDNTYATDDTNMRQATGQFLTVNPLDGSYSIVGSTQSSLQGQQNKIAGLSPVMLLLIAGSLYLALK